MLTRCKEIHEKSFVLQQLMVEKMSGAVKSACETVMVSFDPHRQVSEPIPERWRKALEESMRWPGVQTETARQTLKITTKEDIKKLMAGIVEREADALRNIPVTDAYADAIDLIVEHVGRRGGKLVTSGMGKAGQIAMNIATTFSSTGTPAVFLHPSEAQHGDLGVMQPDDLLLLLSNSGKTREIVELVELARAMNPDVPVIVITGDGGSLLAKEGNVTLLTGGAPRCARSA